MDKFVTAEELLKLKAFSSKLKLITPECDLNREITHVTIMEAPDLYKWVSGGELVLTTWYAFSNNPKFQENNYRELCKKISAIGIKTKRFIKEIPKNIITIAKEEGVPIFEVKYDVKFRELVTIVNSQIQNYQTNMLIEVEEFYNRLLKHSLNNDNLDSLCKMLAIELQATVVCMGLEGNIYASAQRRSHSDAEMIKWCNTVRDNFPNSDDNYFEIGSLRCFKCFSRQTLIGILIIHSSNKLQEKHVIIAHQASMILSVKLWYVFETKEKLYRKLWDELIDYRDDNTAEIDLLLKKLKIFRDGNYYVCVIKKIPDIQAWEQLLFRFFNNYVMIDNSNHIVMLFNGKGFYSKVVKLQELLKEMNINMLIILTKPYENIGDTKNRYNLAMNTYALFNSANIDGIYQAENYMIYTIVKQKMESPEYEYINKKLLEPLEEYDRKFNTELLNTLYYAIICENIETASNELFIHPNTMRYRLNKIQHIIGKNYFNNIDRFFLLIVVMIWQNKNHNWSQKFSNRY